eukprot:1366608-Amorphochlora_amoeboformis.AAC.2
MQPQWLGVTFLGAKAPLTWGESGCEKYAGHYHEYPGGQDHHRRAVRPAPEERRRGGHCVCGAVFAVPGRAGGFGAELIK